MNPKLQKGLKQSVLTSGLIVLLLLGISSALNAKVLNFITVIQEYDQWCWAGVSRSVLYYYGINVSQCAIAEYTRTQASWHDFGSVNCCTDATQGCNYWNYMWGFDGGLREILSHWGVPTSTYTRRLSLSEVTTHINDNRPFVIRWLWDTGGGHFLTGYGVDGNDVYYMNPWFGEGKKIADYNWVVSGGNHTWTHSLGATTPYSTSKYKLALLTTSGGTTNPTPNTYVYNKGTKVTITAIPNDYHIFDRWTGDVSGSTNPLTITMQKSMTVRAHFRTIHAPVSFSGTRATNRNLFQIEHYITLNWNANPANQGINIAKYRIYLVNGTTTSLAEVNPNTFQFIHRQAGNTPQEYAIVAVLSDGRIGYAIFYTVQ